MRSRENDENTELLSENKKEETESEDGILERNRKKNGVKWRRKGIRRSLDTAGVGSFDGKTSNLKSEVYDKRSNLKPEVYDMSLQRDGSYGINKKK